MPQIPKALENDPAAPGLFQQSCWQLAQPLWGATLTMRISTPQMVQPQQLLACSRYQQADEVKQIEFHNSKASAVMGDLSAEETMAVATWFMAKTGAAPFRASPSIEKWLAGPSAVELLRPPKKEVLAYLDGKGPKPGRFARVTMVTKDAVLEYKVGPLVSGSVSSDAKIEILVPAGSIPYAKRPGTEDFFIMFPLVNAVVEEMKPALVEAFGDLHWPSLEDLVSGAPPTTMIANWMPRNDAMAPAGTRRVRVKAGAMPPPPSRLDAR